MRAPETPTLRKKEYVMDEFGPMPVLYAEDADTVTLGNAEAGIREEIAFYN